jgi:hypothetical protein
LIVHATVNRGNQILASNRCKPKDGAKMKSATGVDGKLMEEEEEVNRLNHTRYSIKPDLPGCGAG